MFRNVLIFLLVIGGGVLLVTWLRRPRRLFDIRVTESDVHIVGPVPNHSSDDVCRFLRDLRLPVGSRIVGVADGPSFKLSFSRSVRLDDRDRVRGYLEGR